MSRDVRVFLCITLPNAAERMANAATPENTMFSGNIRNTLIINKVPH